MPRDIERGLAAGFFGYLTKPIKIVEFMQTLDGAENCPDIKLAAAPTKRKRNAQSRSEILEASILIVDDQESNIICLSNCWRRRLHPSSVDDESAGSLRPASQDNYDLILLDLQMPVMDGFQVMEGLKTNTTDAYLPVLVLTAQPGHKLRALQAGAKDFISKPFDLVEVRTRIHNMLEVRLLYKKLENYNKVLEQTVLERTAELRESEARYRSLTELASDWYWEQDEEMNFTKVSGPVLEMLGFRSITWLVITADYRQAGWNEAERALLQERIAARQPFLDFVFSRTNADGSQQRFR
jgi:CheY-like chemotaxis protein